MAQHLLKTMVLLTVLSPSPRLSPLWRQCSAGEAADQNQLSSFVQKWCHQCHSGPEASGQFTFQAVELQNVTDDIRTWEKVIRRLQNHDMPPSGEPRPESESRQAILRLLTDQIEVHSQRFPRPGRTESLRRLNRTEYQNAIRDLLGVNIDVASLLPADESSHGFDNITVSGLSPILLNRYVIAAEKISRLALGRPERSPGGETFRIRGDVTQDGNRIEGLPYGTRGGMRIDWYFPRTGTYQFQIRLMRDRNDEIEGLNGQHQLEVFVDRRRQESFTIQRPANGGDDRAVDAALIANIPMNAGRHQIGITFAENGSSLLESDRQPLNVHFNFYRHPRLGPAVHEVTITGPVGDSSAGNSESRQRILTRTPANPDEFEDCAREILRPLLRLAWRRPVSEEDLQTPMKLFRDGSSEEQDFEAGIERALAGILVNPQFLFRIERDPADKELADSDLQTTVQISDIELASRLSFFLWSSLPDEELLRLAEAGQLSQPDTLTQQTQRMLSDPRAESLVTSFADQWLYLRNLDAVTPDARLFPDFDQNLRDAFRSETEMLFREMLREDRSVLLLLNAEHSWFNERLAKHYGIPHVYGDHFRRVDLLPEQHRGGILRHGSVLSVTSYATRTSPVLRGKWVLENLLGSPPPPPPPDVPALQDNTVASGLSLRDRLAAHRENRACAVCHDRIDPIGFSLENYDAVGRRRESELEHPVNATGGLPDGSQFNGVRGLEQALLQRPEVFVRTVTEKLLIYALGRGMNPEDGAAVRRIVSGAESSVTATSATKPSASTGDGYRFSSIIQGIVHSPPFRMRERVKNSDNHELKIKQTEELKQTEQN
ncbi:MAG: DUF1592 domain-containing protein [Planctomyces sp.]|nr:DUF1592 domain-containing protein [Planctomyces sp.]